MNTTAFVFAAGLGTRLYPLTANKPKALVCYKGRPLLDIVLNKIIDAGIHNIVVNVHHFPDMIIDYLQSHSYPADIRISDERDFLRDTAGGLRFAQPLYAGADLLLLYNVDIVSTIDLTKFIESHISSKADVSLAVRTRQTSRYFVFNQDDMRLCGWHNVTTGEQIMSCCPAHPIDLAFSGIHLMNAEFVNRIPEDIKLSFTPFYIRQASSAVIRGYQHQNDEWLDVGKFEELKMYLT